MSWQRAADDVEVRLGEAGVFNPQQLAPWVVQEASGLEGADWLVGRHDRATVGGMKRIERMAERLIAGEPIQYVLGHWQFRRLDLMVDRRVLIPRPETEQLVDLALVEVDRLAGRPHAPPLISVVDLGTGSGAIGLSVAMERVGTMVAMTDISSDALAVARANLAGHGRVGARVRVVHGEWFEALDHLISDEPPMAAHFSAPDLILANPPYVAYGDELDHSVFEWEPHLALFADEEGLSAVHTIIDGAGERLSADGALLVEIGATQGPASRARAERWAGEVSVVQDSSGRDRFLVARRG